MMLFSAVNALRMTLVGVRRATAIPREIAVCDNDDAMTSDEKRFVIDPFEPVYMAAANRARLREKPASVKGLGRCEMCPRECGSDRLAEAGAFCRTGRLARVVSAAPHHGEEDCLRGWGGSGTIFFGSCNLRCVFCQNWDISHRASGAELSAREIAGVALRLQDAGCHNINLVSPSHVVPQVIEAMVEAIEMGLRLPIVYNTSAYDSLASLRLCDGIVDIYMPDFKVWTPSSGARYLNARDYSERAREAIAEMHRQVGDLRLGPDGVARRGLLVRHLVMPGLLGETAAILKWLAESISRDTFVNIMGQYHPDNQVGRGRRAGDGIRGGGYPEINRRPSSAEMQAARESAAEAGLWRFDR